MNLIPIPIGGGFMLFPDTTGNSIYDKVIDLAKQRR
jgi:hypothetical protein